MEPTIYLYFLTLIISMMWLRLDIFHQLMIDEVLSLVVRLVLFIVLFFTGTYTILIIASCFFYRKDALIIFENIQTELKLIDAELRVIEMNDGNKDVVH